MIEKILKSGKNNSHFKNSLASMPKCKRFSHASISYIYRDNLLKSKRSQGGVFGLSFSMIISIILIVFFIISAWIGIKVFLNYQKCSQIGLFVNELQNDINNAWNSGYSNFRFNATLYSGIESVCILNLSANPKNANNIERTIWNYIQENEALNPEMNLYIYAPEKELCSKWAKLKKIDLSQHNPICAPVIRNVVSFRIEKKFENPIVSVTAG